MEKSVAKKPQEVKIFGHPETVRENVVFSDLKHWRNKSNLRVSVKMRHPRDESLLG